MFRKLSFVVRFALASAIAGCGMQAQSPVAETNAASTGAADYRFGLNYDGRRDATVKSKWTLFAFCTGGCEEGMSAELVLKDLDQNVVRTHMSQIDPATLNTYLTTGLDDEYDSGEWNVHRVAMINSEGEVVALMYPEVRIPNSQDFVLRSDNGPEDDRLVVDYNFGEYWPGSIDAIALGETYVRDEIPAKSAAGTYETEIDIQESYGTIHRTFKRVNAGRGVSQENTHSFDLVIYVEKDIVFEDEIAAF